MECSQLVCIIIFFIQKTSGTRGVKQQLYIKLPSINSTDGSTILPYCAQRCLQIECESFATVPEGCKIEQKRNTIFQEHWIPDREELYNVALDGLAWRSTDYFVGPGAHVVVDGNTNGEFSEGSCTHTKKEVHPWWKVRFNSTAVIRKVKVHNRGDGFSYRMGSIEIRIGGDSDFTRNPVCGIYDAELQGEFGPGNKDVICGEPMTGDYLSVQRYKIGSDTAASDKWAICEVQPFGLWVP